jgi:hypothetical protein
MGPSEVVRDTSTSEQPVECASFDELQPRVGEEFVVFRKIFAASFVVEDFQLVCPDEVEARTGSGCVGLNGRVEVEDEFSWGSEVDWKSYEHEFVHTECGSPIHALPRKLDRLFSKTMTGPLVSFNHNTRG